MELESEGCNRTGGICVQVELETDRLAAIGMVRHGCLSGFIVLGCRNWGYV